MQNLKIYIFVEGEQKTDELRIDGNLNTLRDFVSSLIFSPRFLTKDGELIPTSFHPVESVTA